MKKRMLRKWSAAGLLVSALFFGADALRGEDQTASPAVTSSQALKLSGYGQFLYTAQDPGIDGFSLHRLRLSLTGELMKNIRYKLQVDAVKNPILLDAQVEFVFHEAAVLRVGQFKVPFSQESQTSSADLETINRSQPVLKLAPGQDIGCSGRDVGAVLYGKTSFIEYAVGVFNGAGINKADTNEDKDWAGRLVVHPASFLTLAASFYNGRYSPTQNDPPVKRDRAGLDLAFLYGPFSLKGEFIQASDGDILKNGWYLQAGYFFLPKKLQGIFKVDAYDKDTKTSLDRTNQWTMGLNWLLAEKIKLQINYELYKDESGNTINKAFLVQFHAGF
jgi:phosphate-selective porin